MEAQSSNQSSNKSIKKLNKDVKNVRGGSTISRKVENCSKVPVDLTKNLIFSDVKICEKFKALEARARHAINSEY